NDQRAVDYVELNPVLFAVSDVPEEAQLAQFFSENQNRFRTVETREITLLPLTVPALAAGIAVDEAEIAAEYERTAAQYAVDARRTIHQLPLPDAESAAIFEAALLAGESFASAVSEAGLQTGVSALGTLTAAEITDPALAQAALGLDEGGY